MMTHEDLVNGYLEEAAEEHPDDVPSQITYLKTKRAALWTEVEGGDWEVSQTNFDGASAATKRNISTQERWKACRDAVKRLEGDNSAGRVGILIPRFRNPPL